MEHQQASVSCGLGEPRVGAGGGLRLLVPALGGVVAGVNLAHPLVKRRGDDTEAVSVFIGVNF